MKNDHKKGLMNVLLLTALWLSAITVVAQNKDARQRTEDIKFDIDHYLYGEGWGNTEEEAFNKAQADLVQKISTNITSRMDIKECEVNVNDQLESKTEVESVVHSYTTATLTNLQKIDLTQEKAREKHVFVYIDKEEIQKMFNQKKEKVLDYVKTARNAERNCKMGTALKYYFWAWALLRTLQHPNDVCDDNSEKLATWLPEHINDVFEGLKTEVAKREGTKLTLLTTYHGKKVQDCGFTYHNGKYETDVIDVKDGVSVVDLPLAFNDEQLNIRYEYIYENAWAVDKDVENAMKMCAHVPFKKEATKPVDVPKKDKEYKNLVKSCADLMQTSTTLAVQAEKNTDDLAEIMADVIQAIKNDQLAAVDRHFTSDGWEMCVKLLKYGKAEVIGNPKYSFYKMGNFMVCRSVPMKFSFENNRRQFVEKVTFTFNQDKKIDAIAFGLGDEAVTHIFDRNVGNWSENSRMVIANFLENYKTAFALKRHDYIKTLFADDAVIVTAHVVKKAPKKSLENVQYLENKYVVYNRLDKDQYMERLSKCFNDNEYINIQFSDNTITKGQQGGELYGIQIHQDYYSSHYGDTGYLFLLLDINDPEKPTIFYRAWQPERDPNINGFLPKDDHDYGLYSITILQ